MSEHPNNPAALSPLRRIPPINTLLDHAEARALCERYSRSRVVDMIRGEIDRTRAALRGSGGESAAVDAESVIGRARARLAGEERGRLQRVINATGIVIHTNMGRSAMAEAAVQAASEAARHYSNLEFDLDTGKRGKRASGAEQALCRLTGAEAAAVVNNNAAAVMLALAAIAGGGEVIISRGELVEIGGSFRIPDVLGLSGAILVEVGTTNRTHLRDYERAITPATRAILRVHTSNYRIIGFTKQVPMPDLAQLAERHNLILMEDLGSGALIDLSTLGLPKEPTPQESLGAGAHLVTFSGDKLLGGPQAGLIVGKRELVQRMASHPLYRALRADKMCLAALDATLSLYEQGAEIARESILTLRMLTQTQATLSARANYLAAALAKIPGVAATTEPGESYAGGGALPEMALPTWLVRIEIAELKAHELAELLRRVATPIIGVVRDDALFLDMRTIDDLEAEMIGDALQAISKAN